MSDPWANFPLAEKQDTKPDPWSQFPLVEPQAEKKKYAPYKGEVFPFSRDEEGGFHFDSDAGILGSLKRVVTLPREVYEGKVDPLSDEGLSRTREMAATVAPVTPGVRAGEMSTLFRGKPHKGTPATPSADELFAAGSHGYDAARGMGVDYASDHVGQLSNTLRQDLESNGILRELAPKTHTILDKLIPPAGERSRAPMEGLIAARRALGHIADNVSPDAATDRGAAVRAMRALDEFLEGHDPASVVAGPAAAASQTFREANQNYAAGFRGQALDNVENRAGLNAAVANSGRNVDNAIRQQLKGLLLNPKRSRGFSEAELAQIDRAARGTGAPNVVRHASNLLGGGGGLGQGLTVAGGATAGGAVAGPVGAGVGAATALAAGHGLKSLSNGLTRRRFERASEMTRQRSPLYAERAANPPMTQVSPEARAALIRELELYMLQPPQDEPNFLRISPGRGN